MKRTSSDSTSDKGLILNLQRLSTEDGPGLRTTVFFNGCPLHCAWCHNPESIFTQPQLHWIETRCIGCHSCLKICERGALSLLEEKITIDRNACDGCGLCADNCPANSLELLGKWVEVDELVKDLLKDRAYYESAKDGGVTLSGGEPTLQKGFALELLRQLKNAGIHSALDTCGVCAEKDLLELIPWVDLVLYDLKLADKDQHQQWTGSGNRKVMDNLKVVVDYIRSHSGQPKLWLRSPLIPGVTAQEGNIDELGKFISTNLADVVERWELCAFNNLCRDKYRRLGVEWKFIDTPLLTQEEINDYENIARHAAGGVALVIATGAARIKQEA
jgi:pyruvate formate lyase activating enzyme